MSKGAITPPVTASGVVPEPATYAQIGALLLVALGLERRRRRRVIATQD